MHKAAQAYLQTQVTTTSQGELLLLLYDGAIKFLTQAKERMAARDMAGKGVLISKALDVDDEEYMKRRQERMRKRRLEKPQRREGRRTGRQSPQALLLLQHPAAQCQPEARPQPHRRGHQGPFGLARCLCTNRQHARSAGSRRRCGGPPIARIRHAAAWGPGHARSATPARGFLGPCASQRSLRTDDTAGPSRSWRGFRKACHATASPRGPLRGTGGDTPRTTDRRASRPRWPCRPWADASPRSRARHTPLRGTGLTDHHCARASGCPLCPF